MTRRRTVRPQPPADDAVAALRAVTAELSGYTADLSGYIERRAAELAAPMITAAVQDADARVAAAAAEVQRRDDLAAELRRRLETTDRQLTSWRRATGCRSVADYQIARSRERQPDHG